MSAYRNLPTRLILLLSAVVFCIMPVSSYYQPSHNYCLQEDFKISTEKPENGLDASFQPIYKIKYSSTELFTISTVRMDVKRAVSVEYSTLTVFCPHEVVLIAHYFRAPPLPYPA